MKNFYGMYLVLLILAVMPPLSALANGSRHLSTYSEEENKVADLIMTTSGLRQTVTGTVLEENNSPLPGATVVLKGNAGIGTVTDTNGQYTLNIPDELENPVLVFSFVGYLTEEIAINDRATVDITLLPDITSLEEVVVIGYGTQKKSDLTGAVTAISSEEFNQGFVPTPDQLISGKVAGVQVTSNGGAPGSGSQIRIRGGASLNASNDPLIVIDGVPIATSGVAGSPNPLNFVNPDDIASLNILKDASATAIYGSRASNGVIIITTKKGEADQQLQVNFRTQHSVSEATGQIGVLNADQYRAVVNERGTEAQIAQLGEANTDWQSLIFRPAYATDNNLSIAGAVKTLPYRVSMGYLNQNGILLNSQFKRVSGAISLNPTLLDDHLKINLNVRGVRTSNRFADQGAIGAAVAMDPTKPVYADNNFGGYYQWTDSAGLYTPNATTNPVSILEQRLDESQVLRSIGNVQFDYQFHFMPDLRANLNLGYDISESEGQVLQPANYAPVALQGGSIAPYRQSKTNKLLDFYLNYNKYLQNLSSQIDFTAGYSYQDFYTQEPNFPVLNLEGDTISQGTDVFPQNRLISVFGRLNYTLKDRYLLTATVRRDGSSRFSQDNRWGTFPSLALAWRINEEGFLIDSRAVSELKLRLGYGVTGQQDVTGDFPYLPRYTFSDPGAEYQFGNQYYIMYRPEAYDPNIKWEETQTYNAGLDFGFVNGRISGTLDYYLKQTRDLLSIVPVAAGTNFTNQILTNVGNIDTRGVEAVLNFVVVDGDELSLQLGVNGTYNNITITNLNRVPAAETADGEGADNEQPGVLVGGIAGGTGTTVQIHSVGYAPFTYYVYKQVYDEAGQPVENLFADLNGDNVVNDQDRYRYQSPNAQYYYGFNGTLRYQNWNLSFVARGSVGNYLYDNINAQFGNYSGLVAPGYLSNITSDVYNTNFTNRSDEILISDYYIKNGSFLRMETVNLSYNFGKLFNELINVSASASVQNAFTITNYGGLDPEIPEGRDNNFYPRPRVYAIGLNVGF